MATPHGTIEKEKPGSRYYWGPLLWRMYHILAEFPVNTITEKIWNHVLRKTMYTLPCEKCREHLRIYLETHTITTVNIRHELWKLHNTVNRRIDMPEFPFDDLAIYSIKSEKERLLEAGQLFDDIKNAWTPLYHIQTYYKQYNEWKYYVTSLLNLLEKEYKE